tara:strand:+ start:25 stop:2016 length:1992 start_codon:yes stop_codon:yes gene_type:complete
MADRKPLKVLPDGGGDSTGLGEFVAADTIAVADGGTGSTFGLLSVNPSGAALASQNASKIILVDLTDPATMWDIETFLARVRYTSWYQQSSRGAPPMRGAIWINNAQDEVIWWDLDTDAEYMSFEKGINYYLGNSALTDMYFLDGVLYVGTASTVIVVDFLSDNGFIYSTSGKHWLKGDISERNSAVASTLHTSSLAIVNNTINAVAAMRDPLSFDEFDRPKHWWSVGTAAGACIYNPHNDAIYDWHDDSRTSTKQFLADGRWFFARNQTTYIGVNYINGFGVAADQPTVITHFNPWNSADNSNTGRGSFPWTVAATISGIAGNGDASRVFVSSDEGVCLITICEEYDMYGWNWITASYQTPFMKGARIAAYPLNDLNDQSGSGYTLSAETGTAAYAAGIYSGLNGHSFDGSTTLLTSSVSGKDPGTGDFTVSVWMKTSSATQSADVTPIYIGNSGQTIYVTGYWNSGNSYWTWRANNGSGNTDITTPGDLYDGLWHMYTFTRRDGTLYAYVDGVEYGTASYTANWTGLTHIRLGGWTSTVNRFTGTMAQFSLQNAGWTEKEVNLEYQRGVRGIGGATATLANTDVKSIRIDQNSGLAAITTAANQTEIWDITTGLRESIDATTTATINDADLALKSGADDPEYITGRSGAIEFDGKARRVID